MHRTDGQGTLGTLPTANAPGALAGFFQNAAPGPGVSTTYFDPDWCNAIQEELIAILAAASITPVKGTYNQVLAAVRALITTGTGAEATLRAAADAAEATARAAADAVEATARAAADAAEAATRAAAVSAEAAARAALFSTVNNVTGSRTMGTLYTNTTGRPMFVSAWGYSTGASANLNVDVNGITTFSMGQTYAGSDIAASGIVPAGATYEVYNTSAGVTLVAWVESY